MQNTQLPKSPYETTGIFERTVNWLQHRNRQHAPTVHVVLGSRALVPRRPSTIQAALRSTPPPHQPPRLTTAAAATRPHAGAIGTTATCAALAAAPRGPPAPPGITTAGSWQSPSGYSRGSAGGSSISRSLGCISAVKGGAAPVDAASHTQQQQQHHHQLHHQNQQQLQPHWRVEGRQQQQQQQLQQPAINVPARVAHSLGPKPLISPYAVMQQQHLQQQAPDQNGQRKHQLQPQHQRLDGTAKEGRGSLQFPPPTSNQGNALQPGHQHLPPPHDGARPQPLATHTVPSAVLWTPPPRLVNLCRSGAFPQRPPPATQSPPPALPLQPSSDPLLLPVSLGGIFAAIRNARTLDELADLYDNAHSSPYGSGFSALHVSAALSRMPHLQEVRHTQKPRLVDPRHRQLLDRLLYDFEVHRTAGLYGTRELSACAWVLGKFGVVGRAGMVAGLAEEVLRLHSEALEAAKQAKKIAVRAAAKAAKQKRKLSASPPASAAVPEASSSSSSSAAAAVAVSQETSLPSGSSPHLSEATPVSQQTMSPEPAAPHPASRPQGGPCSALDLANLAVGLAKVGGTDPRVWRRLTEAVSEPKLLRSFGARELTGLAWGLAQAHRRYCRTGGSSSCGGGSSSGSCGISSRSGGSRDGGFDQDSLAVSGSPCSGSNLGRDDILDGRTTAGRPEPTSAHDSPTPAQAPAPATAAEAAVDGSVHLHPDWQPWLGPFVEQLLAPRVQRTLRRFGGKEAPIMVWALARLGHADPRTVSLVAREVEAREQGVTAQGYCLLTWSMATMVLACRRGADGGSGGRSRSGSGDGRSSSNGSGGANGSSESSACSGSQASSSQGAKRGRRKISNNSSSSDSSVSSSANIGAGHAHASRTAAQSPTAVTPGDTQPQQQQGQQQSHRQDHAPLVSKAVLRCLALATARSIWRFSPQGLANMLWGLRVLGLPSWRKLLSLAARVALVRLEEVQPLGLATLLEEWVRAGLYHPALFAAAAAATRERLREFRPHTLVRVLSACGAVRHADRQLFAAAAEALIPASRLSSAEAEAADAHRGMPLDELSPASLLQLAYAYGQAGVHAPRLFSALLVRLAPAVLASVNTRSMSPDAACRLAFAMAAMGYRLPSALLSKRYLGRFPESASTMSAPNAILLALRRRLLVSLPALIPAQAVTAVWALIRTGAVSPEPAALRLGEFLSYSVPQAAAVAATGGLAAALPAAVRSKALSTRTQAQARLLWVLGRGAAAALAKARDLENLHRTRSQPATEGLRNPAAAATTERPADGVVTACMAASKAARELTGGLLAVAGVLLQEGSGRASCLDGEVLAELVAALAAVLAAEAPSSAWGDAGVNESHAALRREVYGLLLDVAAQALRRTFAAAAAAAAAIEVPRASSATSAAAAPATPRAASAAADRNRIVARPAPGLSYRQLASVIDALYDSKVLYEHPPMRAAAARTLMRTLQVGMASVGMPGAASSSQAPSPQQHQQPSSSPRSSQPPREVGSSASLGASMQHQPPQPLPPLPLPPPPSADDIAALLASAARLELFSHPAALPLLRAATRMLLGATTCSTNGSNNISSSSTVLESSSSCSGADASWAPPGAAGAAAPVTPAVLSDLLRYCRPAAVGDPSGTPVGGDGGALQAALYDWAVRQAVRVRRWLPKAVRVRVVADAGVSGGKAHGGGEDVGTSGQRGPMQPQAIGLKHAASDSSPADAIKGMNVSAQTSAVTTDLDGAAVAEVAGAHAAAAASCQGEGSPAPAPAVCFHGDPPGSALAEDGCRTPGKKSVVSATAATGANESAAIGAASITLMPDSLQRPFMHASTINITPAVAVRANGAARLGGGCVYGGGGGGEGAAAAAAGGCLHVLGAHVSCSEVAAVGCKGGLAAPVNPALAVMGDVGRRERCGGGVRHAGAGAEVEMEVVVMRHEGSGCGRVMAAARGCVAAPV
ncbi:hypothetical protein Agub_g8385 [Astrephomene gubernaculifera]|uniref:Uncharacterized protein n=1 Tax=Astrephomene gubernaculifera TaxID=47775 RepID=A0AAD3HME6_9CHLO|nr:hypothetical protein Agub_g8385 [Astrephomene gubernaculifera]